MGLLQKAVDTYNANSDKIGIYEVDCEPLAPIGHTLTRADIEITLDADGNFVTARRVDKSEPKIIIPVTEESGGRTSAPVAHPLCEQLKYLAPKNEREHSLYVTGLRRWQTSEQTHPFLKSILSYVAQDSIMTDLVGSGIGELGKNGAYEEKQLVCWRVMGFDTEEPACWKNQKLQKAFISYYQQILSQCSPNLCMVDGTLGTIAGQHPKGVIAINGNAKLISANDGTNFTYRGRFTEEWQAATVGYEASQKAHNALRWLASNQGVRETIGNRVFLCWNPEGIELPKPMRPGRSKDAEPKRKPSDYQEELRNILFNFHKGNQFTETETALVAAFDAATTGRLSLVYYNEISLKLFLQRMHDWDAHCCWYAGKFGIQAPSLLQIVDCAFGTQRGNFLETDDRIQRQHLQRLLDCKVNGGLMPADIVKALVQRASTPLAYEEYTWRTMIHTACAVLQKYRYDRHQGGNEMAWDLNKKDRSFQFGRLLAVMERAEADYYYKTNENRQTNAIKFMAEYRQRPLHVFEQVNRQLHQAYLNRIDKWQADRYERLKDEIFAILQEFPESEINKSLSDIYLMGYELQRNAFFAKKETDENETEE